MSIFVVDASVGVKWFVPEAHSDAAIRLQDPANDLHVPAFFDVEVANIFWKKVRKGELTAAEAATALLKVLAVPSKRHGDGSLVMAALNLANSTQRTAYDCMYLALAIRLSGTLVTADERFVNSLAGTRWAASIMLVQAVP